jgi:hypothetical protein
MKTKIVIIAIAGVVVLAACKGHSKYELANNSATADTASISSSDTTEVEKLVKTADMSFKVKNVQKTGDNIAKLTTTLNGMVMHHHQNASIERSEDVRLTDDSLMRVSAFSTTAAMTVKVPSDRLEEFMNQVSGMGIYVTGRTMDIEDKSLDYLGARLKLKNRSEMVAQQKTGKIKIKRPEDVLWLKDDMVDGQISNKKIDNAVNFSTVSISFYQSNTIYKEVIANDDPSAYRLPFFTACCRL